MPLELAPEFNNVTREQVEEHLEEIRTLRLAAALEYQQNKEQKLEKELNQVDHRLATAYSQLGKAIIRLDKEVARIEELLDKCEMLHDEAGLARDRLAYTKG